MSLMMSLSTLVATRCRNNSQNAAQHYSPNQMILYHSCCLLVYVTLQIQQSSLISAQNAWTSLSHVPCPFPPFSSAQKSWDWPLLKLKFDNVMSAAQSPVGPARLLAGASPHSGDFLNAISCSSVGTRIDNS